jgi:type IV pilus assembly protein PilV
MLKIVTIRNQRGTTMMEVLVTILILAFGMLGLAGMQMRAQVAQMESYQRAQAVVLMSDMMERMQANRAAVLNDAYLVGTAGANPLGTDNTAQPAGCTALALGAARDKCEWHYALMGAAEKSGATSIGAMIGARGCIEKVQAFSAAPACNPAIFRVTVTWQGMNSTVTPVLACASDKYGTAANPATMRRAISATVSIGQTAC